MGRFRHLALLIGSLICLAQAQPDPRAVRVTDAVEKYMAEKKVTGATVAIAEKGRISFGLGFGFADVENDVPAKLNTVYRLASISKVITAIAVLQLVEAGKLDLDVDIRTYAPEFPDKGERITIRHLLTHTSGVRHYKPNEEENRVTLASVVDSFKRFADDPLLHKPGEKFTYSTYAFSLLARAVETAGGTTFRDYLAEQVWKPAGANDSGLEDLRAIVKNRTRGYQRLADGRLVNSDFADISYKWAGGGMVSTAPDLCRLGIALLQNNLMKAETRELMWTPQKLANGDPIPQSLGWATGDFRGNPLRWHSGAQQMTRTILVISPRDEVVISILTNYESHNIRDLAEVVRDAWYGPAVPQK